MTGVEELLPLLASTFAATAPADAAAGTAAAAGAGAASAAAGLGAAGGIAGTGITASEAIAGAGALAGIGGTAAQLLAKQPKTPNLTPPQRDQAQLEADQRNNLLKSRGRAAALLTPGGGQGISTSSASLGASQLLGSG